MPTDKRARKRAARDAKMQALARQRRRRAATRRTVTLVVVVGVAVGLYAVVSGGSSPKKAASSAAAAQLLADNASQKAGCPSTPSGALTKPHWAKAPPMTIDTSKTYKATVKTDLGAFVITLDAVHAPLTVNNFVFLAQHGFYNCIIFHRVIPQFMDQTGDPTGTGSGGPGYSFADELPKPATPQYPVGAVAMANSGANTNGSQFFVVTGSQGTSLQPNYSLFGQVTSGLSVVDKINADGTPNGVPPKVTHRMLSVTISS